MGRGTLDRKWTEPEKARADAILDVVAVGGGELVGATQIVRALDLPRRSGRQLNASLELVYDTMPLAAVLCPSRYPGKALVRQPDRLYRLTSDEFSVKRDLTDRLKKVHTMTARVAAVATPLYALTDLASLVAVNQIEQMQAALSPAIWDAIVAESERNEPRA